MHAVCVWRQRGCISVSVSKYPMTERTRTEDTGLGFDFKNELISRGLELRGKLTNF
jgi:hypothetical protein